MYTFVTGALRSGRSNYAVRRASELGPPPWLYVGAGEESDQSVHRMMTRHRSDAEAIWRTRVMPPDLRALFAHGPPDGAGAVVVDGFFEWIAGRLASGADEKAILAEVGEVAERLYRSPVPIVVVSTEVLETLLPEDPHKRLLLRVASSANQMLASLASATVLMVSGLPLRVR